MNISHPMRSQCSHVPVVLIAADGPLVFPTVQLYVPKMSVTLWAMVSTVWYVPVTGSATTCVCWSVALRVITTPSFLQVTVVAGPPVEVQVRDLVVSSLYTNEVAVGTPEIKNHGVDFVSSNKITDVTQFIYTCNNVYLQRRGHKVRMCEKEWLVRVWNAYEPRWDIVNGKIFKLKKMWSGTDNTVWFN